MSNFIIHAWTMILRQNIEYIWVVSQTTWLSTTTFYIVLYVVCAPTSNLFLNISYGSVFLKMCYIMWLWCHRNVTHVIELYRIRKDGGGGGSSSCWKKKLTSCQNFRFCHPLDKKKILLGHENLRIKRKLYFEMCHDVSWA